MNQFRIGGVYRIEGGNQILKLVTHSPYSGKREQEGRAFGVYGAEWTGCRASFDLSTGENLDGDCNLIPGELHQVNGEWVPRGYEEAKPAETLGDLLRQAQEKLEALQKVNPDPAASNEALPAEPLRERLTWADSKPFDAFDGFEVVRGQIQPADYAEPVHPLTRMEVTGHLTDPRHALASTRT